MTRLDLSEKTDDEYVLPRNEVERERLKNQHKLLTEVFDGRLVIDKTVKLQPGHRILDSGTGAASWILDLLNIAPQGVDIVGIDISTAMIPADIPKNVSLYELSVMDLPSSWGNSFDLINQRLLIGAFTIERWQTSISELFRILKPGGRIQITEVGYYGTSDESTTLPAMKVCYSYCDAIFRKRNLLGFGCQLQLPVLMKEAGFADIHVEVRKIPFGKQQGELGVMAAQNWDGVFRAMGIACLEEGGLGVCESRAEIELTIEQAKREWDENPGVFIQLYAITAVKPL